MAAVYLDKNACIQSEAALLGRTMFIEEDEARRASKVFQMPAVQERAWGYWVARLPRGWKKDAGLVAASAATKRRVGMPTRSAGNRRGLSKAKRSGAAQK